jgi:hypothetical protein
MGTLKKRDPSLCVTQEFPHENGVHRYQWIGATGLEIIILS